MGKSFALRADPCYKATMAFDDASLMKEVSARELREYRMTNALTQAQLAFLLGIKRPTLTQWENRQTAAPVSAHRALRYLIALKRLSLTGALPAISKLKSGRPLNDRGFALRKAICPHPDCKR